MTISNRKAYLGLGGNIGNVQRAMANALQRLQGIPEIEVTNVSPVYKTPPWGVEDQPWFLNCCAEINTTLAPEALLEVCQTVEREGKRERIVRWGPRTIDVDILIVEGVEQIEQRLTIPHPRIKERAFVLIPLADIAPSLKLDGKPIQVLADEINGEGIEEAGTLPDWWQAK